MLKKKTPSLAWVERELLDTIAFNPSVMWIAEELLTPEDFSSSHHKQWYMNLRHAANNRPPSQAVIQNTRDLAQFIRDAAIRRAVVAQRRKEK